MYMYWWNVLLVLLGFFYLIVKAEQLHKTNKRLKQIIYKLEGINEEEDMTLEERGGSGDWEGHG